MIRPSCSLRFALIGKSGSGKTSLLNRFLASGTGDNDDNRNDNNDGLFPTVCSPTRAVAFGARPVPVGPNQVVRVEVWDTPGSDDLRSVTGLMCHGSAAIVVCVDLQDPDALLPSNLDPWLELAAEAAPDAPIVLCGTKADPVSLDQTAEIVGDDGAAGEASGFSGHRQHSLAEVLKFAQSRSLVYVEVSAHRDAFRRVADKPFTAAAHLALDAIAVGSLPLQGTPKPTRKAHLAASAASVAGQPRLDPLTADEPVPSSPRGLVGHPNPGHDQETAGAAAGAEGSDSPESAGSGLSRLRISAVAAPDPGADGPAPAARGTATTVGVDLASVAAAGIIGPGSGTEAPLVILDLSEDPPVAAPPVPVLPLMNLDQLKNEAPFFDGARSPQPRKQPGRTVSCARCHREDIAIVALTADLGKRGLMCSTCVAQTMGGRREQARSERRSQYTSGGDREARRKAKEALGQQRDQVMAAAAVASVVPNAVAASPPCSPGMKRDPGGAAAKKSVVRKAAPAAKAAAASAAAVAVAAQRARNHQGTATSVSASTAFMSSPATGSSASAGSTHPTFKLDVGAAASRGRGAPGVPLSARINRPSVLDPAPGGGGSGMRPSFGARAAFGLRAVLSSAFAALPPSPPTSPASSPHVKRRRGSADTGCADGGGGGGHLLRSTSYSGHGTQFGDNSPRSPNSSGTYRRLLEEGGDELSSSSSSTGSPPPTPKFPRPPRSLAAAVLASTAAAASADNEDDDDNDGDYAPEDDDRRRDRRPAQSVLARRLDADRGVAAPLTPALSAVMDGALSAAVVRHIASLSPFNSGSSPMRSTGARAMCVAVTGATGFLGMHVCAGLLLQGFLVNATVRSLRDHQEAVAALRRLPGASLAHGYGAPAGAAAKGSGAHGAARAQLMVFEATLEDRASYELPLSGCAAVIHCAALTTALTRGGGGGSSIDAGLSADELVERTVTGAHNVFAAALAVGTVRRFVLPSSLHALCETPVPGHVYTAADFNGRSTVSSNPAFFAQTRVDRELRTLTSLATSLSAHVDAGGAVERVSAPDQRIWRKAAEAGLGPEPPVTAELRDDLMPPRARFELVSVCAPLLVGPPLSARSCGSVGPFLIRGLLSGEWKTVPENVVFCVADVRSVSEAIVRTATMGTLQFAQGPSTRVLLPGATLPFSALVDAIVQAPLTTKQSMALLPQRQLRGMMGAALSRMSSYFSGGHRGQWLRAHMVSASAGAAHAAAASAGGDGQDAVAPTPRSRHFQLDCADAMRALGLDRGPDGSLQTVATERGALASMPTTFRPIAESIADTVAALVKFKLVPGSLTRAVEEAARIGPERALRAGSPAVDPAPLRTPGWSDDEDEDSGSSGRGGRGVASYDGDDDQFDLPVCVIEVAQTGPDELIKHQRDRIVVTQKRFLVGRSPSCHLRLLDNKVSSQHCVLEFQWDPELNLPVEALVRDMSKRGTFVAGERLAKGETASLKPGSVVSIARKPGKKASGVFIVRELRGWKLPQGVEGSLLDIEDQ